MLLDREWGRVEVELDEVQVDILGGQGASHEVTEPVGHNLDKEHRVRGRGRSEPGDLTDDGSEGNEKRAQNKVTVCEPKITKSQ